MIEDKLLTISYKFRQSKIWEYWQPGQVFVLDLPGEDSAVVRLDVLMSDDYRVLIFKDMEAYQAYLLGEVADDEARSFQYLEVALANDYVVLTFQNKSELMAEEVSRVQEYKREHELVLGGAHSFPRWRHYAPYREPWSLGETVDQAWLVAVMEALLKVSALLQDAESLDWTERPARSDRLDFKAMTRSLENAEPALHDVLVGEVLADDEAAQGLRSRMAICAEWQTSDGDYDISVMLLDEAAEIEESGLAEFGGGEVPEMEVDHERLRALRECQTTVRLECDLIALPLLVKTAENAPGYYPWMVVAADQRSGNTFATSLVDSMDSALAAFIDKCQEEDLRPLNLVVRNRRAQYVLQPLADELNISNKIKATPLLDTFEQSLYEEMVLSE